MTSGLVIDLDSRTIANGGFGNAESYSIAPGSNVLIEVNGTHLSDSIAGSERDERFILNGGSDTLDAGAGFDLLRYDRANVDDLTVDLAAGIATGTWGGTSFVHSISNIEQVRGSDEDDLIIGGNMDEHLMGGVGYDTLKGGAGYDRIDGGAGIYDVAVFDVTFGDAIITRSEYDVTVSSGLDGTDIVYNVERLRFADRTVNAFTLETVEEDGPTDGDDVLTGTDGDDFINGLDGNDSIYGLGGDDVLSGGAGDDLINPGDNFEGYDLVIPGSGNDTVNMGDVVYGYVEIAHRDLDEGISITVDAGANTGQIDKGANGQTLLLDVENPVNYWGLGIVRTSFDDRVTFTHADVGPDYDGFGYLEYVVEGGSNLINVLGGVGAVRLNYRNGDEGIIADLTTGIIQNGSGGTDRLVDTAPDVRIEIRGTNFADVIKGTGKGERFILERDNDTLDGGGGDDMVRYDRGGVERVTVNLAASSAVGIWYGKSFIHSIQNVESVRGSLSGNDVMIGDAADNGLYGYGGDDNLQGDAGNDTLNGWDGHDLIDGGVGDDLLLGYAGDDMLTGGAGNDTVRGGEGVDTAIISDALRAADGSLNIGITVAEGGIILTSADGSDFYYDDVETFMFSDTVASRAVLLASATPVITGTNNAENVNGTDATEIINAGGGGDWITPGAGSDTIDGGDGRDMLSFVTLADTPGRTNVQYRLDLDLTAGTATTSGPDVYTISNVERVTGTIFADRIKGDAGDNELRGLGDYDWFTATTGNDTIDGGTGQDMISYVDWMSTADNTADPFNPGGAPPPNAEVTGVVVDLNDTSNNTNLAAGHSYISVERVTGSGRQDVFYGDENENDFRGLGDFDWFVGSTGGRERYFGGDGSDTVTYYNSISGVSASLRNGARVGGEETGRGTAGDAALDLYFSIENLVGTNYADSLTGNEQRNNLNGLAGDDFIFGYGGIDIIKGGAGNDVINGGAGSDYALFNGNRADYGISRVSSTEVRTNGVDGFDIHIDVEYFRFEDGDVSIWELAIV